MQRFVSRRFVAIFPLLRNLSDSQIPRWNSVDGVCCDGQKMKVEERFWRSPFNLGFRSFSTETAKKKVSEASKSEEAGEVDKKKEDSTSSESSEEEPETLATEVPSVEELTIETLRQKNKEYKSILQEKEKSIESLNCKLEEEKKKVLSELAAGENLRSRFARESAQTKKFAVQGFVQSLLGCLDNLDRAVESVPQQLKEAKENGEATPEQLRNAMEGLLTGVRMTQTEFKNVLSAQGVERYNPLNEMFDPNRHMARFELEDPSKEPGTVGIVTLCGYKMHDRIIRPAEVGVVKKREEAMPSKEEEKEASH